MDISAKIKKIRNDNSLSQEKFADMIGVSRQSIIAYEKGKTIPQTDVLIEICKKFNLNLNYFVDDCNETQEKPIKTINKCEMDDCEALELKYNAPILKQVTLNDKSFINEVKKDIDKLELKKVPILPLVFYSATILFLILDFFVDYIGWFFIPCLVLAIIFKKKYKRSWYTKYYIKKYNMLSEKHKLLLSPQYEIFMKLESDGIYIYNEEEIVFYCSYNDYDHHVFLANNTTIGPLLNVSPRPVDIFYSLVIYLKGNGNPYLITFPLLFKDKIINNELYLTNKYEYTKCLNNCAMNLKLIEDKNPR